MERITTRRFVLRPFAMADWPDVLDLGRVILARYQDKDHDREALGAMVAAIFEDEGIGSIVTKNAPDQPEQLAPLQALAFQAADQEHMGILVLSRPQP